MDNLTSMSPNTDYTNLEPKQRTLKVFSISGLAIFLTGVVITWGLLNVSGALKPSSFYSFANIASAVEAFGALLNGDEEFTIIPSNYSLYSGDLFTLTLEHRNKSSAKGEYSLEYPCVSDFKLERLYQNVIEALRCGEKSILGDADLTGITLKTALENSESLNVPILVYFKGVGGNQNKSVYAQALITVTNENGGAFAATTTSTSAAQTAGGNKENSGNSTAINVELPKKNSSSAKPPVSTPAINNNTISTATVLNSAPKAGVKTEKTIVYYSAEPTTSNPSGSIDLEARILEIGFVDKNTNLFTASSSPSANLRIAVRFEVINKGTKVSGSWSFNAVLPTMPFHIYSGDSQQSLMPGEKIEFLLGFDSIERKKDAEFILNVDPTGRVVESNEWNNIVKVTIHPAF